MIATNVRAFLAYANADATLSKVAAGADSYETLAEVASQAGFAVSPDELRSAFRNRNARVLTAQMIQRGLAHDATLPAPPAWNQDGWNEILALDLTPVLTQLVNRKGWSVERAASTERKYRRYLYLAIHQQGRMVPTDEIDEMWHQHILNTQKYAADCQRLAGRFLHHKPCESAAEQVCEAQSEWFDVWVAYETLFNEPYDETIGAALLTRYPNVAAAA